MSSALPDVTSQATSAALDLAHPLLTADDVATLLGIPRSSVYEYARRLHNPLPSIAIGRHRRFHRSAIERWLGEQTRRATW